MLQIVNPVDVFTNIHINFIDLALHSSSKPQLH